MPDVSNPSTMVDTLVHKGGKYGKDGRGKTSMSNVEISAWLKDDIPPEAESKMLRSEEKALQRERKMLSDILKRWDPSLVSTKAKDKFSEQMKSADKRLKEIRRKLR